MKNESPLILVSNDDGVTAKGINELIRMLRPLGEVVVMAPDSPRSGAACSLTSKSPVHYALYHREEGLTVYACSGTPVDCVKLAMHDALPRRPDVVIGGINHGDNSAVNVHYSGTMGVVLEGCMKGVPSIGFSLCDHDPDADFAPLTAYVQGITKEVLRHGLPGGVCLNVNFPLAPSFRGVKVCRQTRGGWHHEWADCPHPYKTHYYWLTGSFQSDDEGEDSDAWALNNGYVAITPVKIDVTAYEMMEQMKDWNLDI